jgi:hypothetical protein
VNDIPILGRDDEQNILNEFAANYGAPAYVRRAREVQEAYEALLVLCRQKRDEWLVMVRTRLGLLHALAGDWPVLTPLLHDAAHLDALRHLQATLEPRLRARVTPTSSPRALRKALLALRDSIERFNRRWHNFLPTLDLTRANQLRDSYNRYYVLEKECSVRSYRLAAHGFRKLEPLTVEHFANQFPALPVPTILA